MNRRWIAALMMVVIILAAGCQAEREEPTPQSSGPAPEPEVTEPVEEEPIVDYFGELDVALNNGDLVEITRLMEAFIPMISTDQADDVVRRAVQLMNDGLMNLTDAYYSESYLEIHRALVDARQKAGTEFASPDGYLGKSKDMVVSLVENPEYVQLLQETFTKGYGLLMAEGTYYPAVDYVILSDLYGDYVSAPMAEYLSLLQEVQLRRPLVEEYLAISPMKLADRAVAYERFLKKYPDFPEKETIRIQLMAAIYKLAGPSPFDGLLTSEFEFSDELKAAYAALEEADDCPVIQFTIGEIQAFSEERGGILGSMETIGELFDKAFEIHNQAGEMVFDLYFE